MRRLAIVALTSVALAGITPALSAQAWLSINQRQAQLDQRIDEGVRNGSLSRAEAVKLRSQFRDIARLEAQYRRTGGLSYYERQDLDRRFDTLSARIRYERHDAQTGRQAMSINERQANIIQRIDAGVRSRQLTAFEAARLRKDYNDIARLEARYRRGGLQPVERNYLNYRLTALSRQIKDDRHDEDRWYF